MKTVKIQVTAASVRFDNKVLFQGWGVEGANYCWNRCSSPYDKWVPVTAAWCVLRLRREEGPPIWRVAANILNKQSRTTDKGWSSSLGFGRGANNSSP